MAKGMYIGDSNGTAKKIKSIYIGDSNGIAKKVKKVYIGDSDGIARLSYEDRVLSSISITSNPTTTSYAYGGALNLSGLKVSATYTSGNSSNVTNYTTSPANGSTLTTSQYITVSYTENGVTKTTSFYVSVAAAPSTKKVKSITITQNPTTVQYRRNRSISTAGMKVKAKYTNGTTATNVASSCTISPTTSGSVVKASKPITVSYSYGGATATAIFYIKVTS